MLDEARMIGALAINMSHPEFGNRRGKSAEKLFLPALLCSWSSRRAMQAHTRPWTSGVI